MGVITRREFIATAAAFGASLAWRSGYAKSSRVTWTERRDLYPQGVASADPHADSVILWTRRPFEGGDAHKLTVEIADDAAFKKVVAVTNATVSDATDWTCRVLAANLKPGRVYWYRFTDRAGVWQQGWTHDHGACG